MRYDLSSGELRVRDYYRIGWDVLKRNRSKALLLLVVICLPAALLETWLRSIWNVTPFGEDASGYGSIIMLLTSIVVAIVSAVMFLVTEYDMRDEKVSIHALLVRVVRCAHIIIAALILYYLAISNRIGVARHSRVVYDHCVYLLHAVHRS